MIEAKVIEDSVSPDGERLTTLQVKFQRFVLPEFNTHRAFSRNFSSSRAIPSAKLIEQVRNDPAMPLHWGKNQPGMQADEELQGEELAYAKGAWMQAANYAAEIVEDMTRLGVHKQVCNRIIEPFMWVTGIVTASDFDNFFALRCHKDAQPEIQALAYAMRNAIRASTPTLLKPWEWHMPYVTYDERRDSFFQGQEHLLLKISAARCCRVSYLTIEGRAPSVEQDLALCDRLAGSRPVHASPFEHVARPLCADETPYGNFHGWMQFRKVIEDSLC